MSATRYPLGLVVGKFAPLHRGHERLIATAASQCERLLLLSYSKPELPRCEPAHRREWLERRFPEHAPIVLDDAELRERCNRAGVAFRPLPRNDAPDADQQAFLGWLLRDVLGERPHAIFCNEAYGPPCAASLSEALGHKVAAVLPDPERIEHPVSGTALRTSLRQHALEIDPEVSVDLVPRIALLGGESSGKSVLAVTLARELGGALVTEFGRQWWHERNGQLGTNDLLHIARTQIAHEREAARALPPIVVGDTSPLTTLGYSLWMEGRAPPELVSLSQRRYDAFILCLGDFPFQQDGTRRDARFRSEQQAWYRCMLAGLDIPSIEVGGSLHRRTRRVLAFLRVLGLGADSRLKR